MKQVTVHKAKLVDRILKNRRAHRAIFEEALDGWKKKAISVTEKLYEDARAGRLSRVQFYLPRPEDHTAEYDRALEMLGMEVGDTVTIGQEDFAHFVQDDWGWKREFMLASSAYSASARASLGVDADDA